MEKTKEAGIYLLKTGRYRVRATAKCPITGSMLESQKTLKSGATIKEAIALRDELKSGLVRSQTDDSKITTVESYATLWLERKSRRLRPSTINKNTCVLSDFILPQLGHRAIEGLTRRDVSEWIMWAEKQKRDDGRPYSTEYVAGWWRVLRGMLRDAYAQGFITDELTLRQDPPDTGVSGRQETQTLTGEQLGQFLTAARKFAPSRYAEVVTLALTGMRPGELYGLHWVDVDLDRQQLTVRYSMYRGILGPPKTKAARTVPLPQMVIDALQEHRKEQVKNQSPGLAQGIVFPADHGGYRLPTSLRKALNVLREHLGFSGRVTPQVFRRTYNTLMATAHVDRVVLRSIMGHTSEAMTERYSGVGMELKQAAITKVFSIEHLGPHLGPPPTTWDLGEVEGAGNG